MEQRIDDFLENEHGADSREWIAALEARFVDDASEAMDTIQARAMSLLRVGICPEDVANSMKLPHDLLAIMMLADMGVGIGRGAPVTRISLEEKFRADVCAAYDFVSGRETVH